MADTILSLSDAGAFIIPERRGDHGLDEAEDDREKYRVENPKPGVDAFDRRRTPLSLESLGIHIQSSGARRALNCSSRLRKNSLRAPCAVGSSLARC